tara:strand:- start:540 stop:1649 length:1110 start_codon:yes stop_codon:yes gene_type:complete
MSKKRKIKAKKVKTKKIKSKLIGKGSFGCVFRPNIPCKKDVKKNKTIKRDMDRVSKVMLQDSTDEIKKEYRINLKILKIKNYKEWAFIWDKVCYPPNYQTMIELAEIQKCMKKFKKTEEDYNKSSFMMLGAFGGEPLMKYGQDVFKKSVFNSVKMFKKKFLSFFESMEPLFIGIVALQKAKICHQDLSSSNIMHKEGKFYMVDFGLSCTFSDKKSFRERSYSQLQGSRVYDPYPYDYIFCFGDKAERKRELNGYNRGFFKTYHDDYIKIHKGIFERGDIDDEITQDLSKINKNKIEVIKKLDTYSIGILILTTICDIAEHYKVPIEKIYKCFKQPDIQNQLALLKDMTEYKSKSRITPDEAYKRYKSLV